MAEITGSSIYLLYSVLGTGADFEVFEGQHNLTIPGTRAEIDVSNKDQPEEQAIGGRLSQEVTLECRLFGLGEAASRVQMTLIKGHCRDGTVARIGYVDNATAGTPPAGPVTAKFEADASVLEYRESFPDADSAIWSARFKLIEAWA